MADSDVMSDEHPSADPSPRVHDRAALLLAAAGLEPPVARGGAVLGLTEPAVPSDPPTVAAAGGGCGGGRRVVLDGRAVFLTDGVRPTHLLAHAVDTDGTGVRVLLERGDRGVEPWPREGATTGELEFRSVRLDAGRVVTGIGG